MKKLMMVIAVATFAFLQSCEQDPTVVTIDEFTVEAEAIMESDFDEIDELSDLGMQFSLDVGGRTTGDRDDRMTCAEVTVDRENRTITIDFGEGCTDPRGRTRSGKIIIVHSEFWYQFGGTTTTTLENYMVNDRAIEGTRVVTNMTETSLDNHKANVVLTGGKVTWPDESFATREVDRTREWIRANNPAQDERHILVESIASGLNRGGEAYSATVTSTLVYKRACRLERVRIPVSGTKTVIKGDRTMVVDFGDGTCDNIITVTSGDITKTIDLSSHNE